MGFFRFAGFFLKGEIEIPHRTFGLMAKDYCIGLSVSDKEARLLSKLLLDKERFVPARNALLVKIFNLFFKLAEEQTDKNPDATFKAARGFFLGRMKAYYDSLPEPEKPKMKEIYWATEYHADYESSAERLYQTVSGMEFGLLPPNLQTEFKEIVNDYFDEVVVFFKENSPKFLL